MSKLCPVCHRENRDQAKRCLNCNHTFSETNTHTRLCPAGRHVMDPGWSSCPYCFEQPAVPRPSPPPGTRVPTQADEIKPTRQATVREDLQQPQQQHSLTPSRRQTQFADDTSFPQSESTNEAALPVSHTNRKIVALLVTYTWNSSGQVFPVFDGRNYIGSDEECEICIKDDPQISAIQSSIIFRGKKFMIDDEKSRNGTLLNGEAIDEKQPLHNYAGIRTGATEWIFIDINPQSAEGTDSSKD